MDAFPSSNEENSASLRWEIGRLRKTRCFLFLVKIYGFLRDFCLEINKPDVILAQHCQDFVGGNRQSIIENCQLTGHRKDAAINAEANKHKPSAHLSCTAPGVPSPDDK